MPEQRDIPRSRTETGAFKAFSGNGRSEAPIRPIETVGDSSGKPVGFSLREPIASTPLEQLISEPPVGIRFNPGHTKALLGNNSLAPHIWDESTGNGDRPTTVEVPLSTIRSIMTSGSEADKTELRFLLGQELNQVGLDGLIAAYGYVAKTGGTDESSITLREKIRSSVIDTMQQHAALTLLPRDMRPEGYEAPDLHQAAMAVLAHDKVANRV